MHVCDVCVCVCMRVCMCVCVHGSVYVCSNYEASSMIMEITLMAFPIKTEDYTDITHVPLVYG